MAEAVDSTLLGHENETLYGTIWHTNSSDGMYWIHSEQTSNNSGSPVLSIEPQRDIRF